MKNTKKEWATFILNEYKRIDPRDFTFTQVPQAQWEYHQPLPDKHRLWEKHGKDISVPDDPLGEKRVF
ncbi:hypothetical protein FAI40_01530 [Acetobacteraceae bacterium]|nr:hypothetical protein FAI40_01530 [Acetobacteraceae bacterium]